MFTLSLRCVAAISTWLIFSNSPVWGDSLQQETSGVETDQHLTAEKLTEWVIKANPGLASSQAAAEAAAHRINPAGSLDDPRLRRGNTTISATSCFRNCSISTRQPSWAIQLQYLPHYATSAYLAISVLDS